ncbi:MAG: S-adenosyl-l-methionine hydroxide adenosyltransferase family protein [Actinomycetaceae bacterium]|nr:S-adenosyl-l-methionine hydroxide adenosyltransferase family protein [Actinomycetaceae bacterium]
MMPLILQSDFGQCDGAVSAMYGVAYTVDPKLPIYDLTHFIPPYDVWEGSCRLVQTLAYWPAGSVFVSVVDPGVGSSRLSVVAKTNTGHYVVTPDNGTLTHVAIEYGIDELREIDESVNRLPGSGESYTFHGRDIYAFTGARLATGHISFEEVGPSLDPKQVVTLPTMEPYIEGNQAFGTIDTHDVRYGSLWTNVPRELFLKLGVKFGDYVRVHIESDRGDVYSSPLRYCRAFSDASIGEALLYTNSLDNMAIAINRGSFAKAYSVGQGVQWKVTFTYPLNDAPLA